MPSLLLITAVTAASMLLSIAEAIMYKLVVASSSSVAFKGSSQQSLPALVMTKRERTGYGIPIRPLERALDWILPRWMQEISDFISQQGSCLVRLASWHSTDTHGNLVLQQHCRKMV